MYSASISCRAIEDRLHDHVSGVRDAGDDRKCLQELDSDLVGGILVSLFVVLDAGVEYDLEGVGLLSKPGGSTAMEAG